VESPAMLAPETSTVFPFADSIFGEFWVLLLA
jgi:hypothetical protein